MPAGNLFVNNIHDLFLHIFFLSVFDILLFSLPH